MKEQAGGGPVPAPAPALPAPRGCDREAAQRRSGRAADGRTRDGGAAHGREPDQDLHGRQGRGVDRGQQRLVRAGARGDAGPGRRERLRQDHGRPLRAQADRAHRGADRTGRPGDQRTRSGRAPGAQGADAAGLPGPLRLAQSQTHRLPDGGRAARAARQGARRAQAPRRRHAGARGPLDRRLQLLPRRT